MGWSLNNKYINLRVITIYLKTDIMNKLITLLLLSTLVLSSCKKDTTAEPDIVQKSTTPLLDRVDFAGEEIYPGTRCMDGNILFVSGDNYHTWMRKISATDGSTMWTTEVRTSRLAMTDIKELDGGNIWIAVSGYVDKLEVLCFNSSGDKQWEKEYQTNFRCATILPQTGNEALLVGSDETLVKALKLNSSGDSLFTKTQNISSKIWAPATVMTTSGNIAIVSHYDNYPQLSTGLKLVLLNDNFDIISQAEIDPGNSKLIRDCIIADNGDILCTGEEFSTPKKGFVMRLDNSLNVLQTDIYSRSDSGIALQTITSTPDGYAVAGTITNTDGSTGWVFVASHDQSNNTTIEKQLAHNYARESGFGIFYNGSGHTLTGQGNNEYYHIDKSTTFFLGLDENLNVSP